MNETERTDGAIEPSGIERDVDALLQAAETDPRSALPGAHPRRDALDLQEHEIKDAVLRMGALVEEAIRRASRSLVVSTTASWQAWRRWCAGGSHSPRRRG